ncbi:MAG: acetyl-CoA hydrolase/transferase family protein [Deltaproteobacteria bacterium]|nr:MAG: acetyl-CoA hydrolase/transferase family protein [Deltaproteobacteria bacterium]TMQ24205.1 MAG: acetyl-CoA hydrolase/transferase family protein [Deltaproteobacteria bacterium]
MELDSSWAARAVSAADAIAHVRSGARVFVHGAAATPVPLLDALAARRDLEGVRLYHLHTQGASSCFAEGVAERIRSVSMFVGADARPAVADGRADFMPVFLSDIPVLFASGAVPLDVAIVQLSPPDRHGLLSLGTSVDAARAAVDHARIVIAEINDRMPRTHGNAMVELGRIHAFIHTSRPLPSAERPPPSEVEARIGEQIAALVEDGATLQTGIGGIPDAVLARLGNHADLGVHTEMFSDGLIPLLDGGVITNRRKAVHPGRTVTSFVTGSQALYDYIHDHLAIEFHGCDRTNDTALIRKNDRVTAINAAIEVDLTGQVCADSMGPAIWSGIGGQMDFLRGAALSRGGKPIIALPSTAARGTVSRITAQLKPGAGVVTTRGHVHWVVTEYGARNLHGLTLRERGEALISIAHPDVRGELRRALAALRHYVIGAPGTPDRG